MREEAARKQRAAAAQAAEAERAAAQAAADAEAASLRARTPPPTPAPADVSDEMLIALLAGCAGGGAPGRVWPPPARADAFCALAGPLESLDAAAAAFRWESNLPPALL